MFPSIIDCRTYTSSFIKNGKDLCQPPVDILTCYNENLRLSILDSSKALSCVSELQCVSCAVMSDSLQPHGLQHARLLCPWNAPGKNTEWVAISFSRGPSQSRDWTGVSCTAGRVFSIWATREAQHWACLWFVLLPAGQISCFFFFFPFRMCIPVVTREYTPRACRNSRKPMCKTKTQHSQK